MESSPAPQSSPPPVPKYKEPFVFHAAKLSLWLSFLGLAISVLGSARSPALSALSVFLLIVGLIFGIVALCGVSQHGSSRILGRALTGVVLNGLFAFGLIATLIAGARAKNQQSFANLNQEIKKAQDDMKKSFESEEGLQNDPERLESLKKAFEKGADETTGDARFIFKAGAAYTEKVNAASEGYRTALKTLEDAGGVSTDGLNTKEDIQARREIVKKFLVETVALKKFTITLENLFVAEMRKQLPNNEKVVQQGLKGYRSKADIVNPLMIKVRETDEQIGAAMLGMLDVLEKNWGAWENGEEGPEFESDEAIDEYNLHFEKLQAAAAAQEEAQRKLLSSQ